MNQSVIIILKINFFSKLFSILKLILLVLYFRLFFMFVFLLFSLWYLLICLLNFQINKYIRTMLLCFLNKLYWIWYLVFHNIVSYFLHFFNFYGWLLLHLLSECWVFSCSFFFSNILYFLILLIVLFLELLYLLLKALFLLFYSVIF